MNVHTDAEGLPPPIQEEFRRLSDDLHWLHTRWAIFRQLYVHSKTRIGLLNASAPTFFWIIQQVLIDDIVLGLWRFVDPKRQSGSDNLSLEQLLALLPIAESSELRTSLHERLVRFRERHQVFRDHRRKRIAHRDLRIALKRASNPLGEVTDVMIDGALAEIGGILNAVEGYFCNSETLYEMPPMRGDADSLVTALVESLRYEELQQSGALKRDDLDSSEWWDAIGVTY